MTEERPPPWPLTFEVKQQVNQLFHELIHQSWGAAPSSSVASWEPSCDVTETQEAIVVEIELPGVNQEDVRVEVEGDMLRIAGERRSTSHYQGQNVHRVERRYGRFSRQLQLPHSVVRDAIQAEFSDGVLTVTLPKQS